MENNMKALKILLGIFISIFILVIGAGLALNYFLDLNKYIPTLESKLEASTGLVWSIEGPIKVGLFPGANLSVEGISAEDKGNAKVAQLKGQSFAFDSAHAKVAWFPQIMSKEIVIKEFALDKLRYAKRANDGAVQNLRLQQIALQDIYVGFADMKKQGLIIRPNNTNKGIGLNLNAEVEQLSKTGQSLSQMHIDFKANLEVETAASTPLQKLTMTNTQINLVLKMPQFKGDGLDTKINADVVLDLNAKAAALTNVKLTAAGEELRGKAHVNFAQSQPRITFDFNGKDLSLDGLFALMAVGDTTQTAEKSQDEAATNKPAKPAKPLPKFNVDGHIVLSNLKVKNILLDTVDLKIKGKDGAYNIAPLKAALYGGDAALNISVQGQSAPAKCAVEFDVKGIMLGGLLKAAANKDILDGALQTAGNMAVPCLAGPIDVSAVKGVINSTISNGVIQKWNVSKVLNQAQSVAKALADGQLKDVASIQNAMNVNQGDDRFEFTKMIANITLENGVAHNSLLDMQAPLSEISGDGQLDIVKSLIDYNLRLNLSKTKDNNKYFVPIKLSGPLLKPSYKIDTQKLLSSQLGSKLKDKLSKELDGKLDGALGGELLKALPF
tara:strand:+ start:8578 stop:10410 length:1833 start_codon:yes stop_codon:yes gene_type:complete